jgi:hypothetical protein
MDNFSVDRNTFPRLKDRCFTNGKRHITDISWNASGSRLCTLDSEIKVWTPEYASLQKPVTLPGSDKSHSLCSFWGEQIVAGLAGDCLGLWDLRDKEPAKKAVRCQGHCNRFAWRPDGLAFAVGHTDEPVLQVYDLAADKFT